MPPSSQAAAWKESNASVQHRVLVVKYSAAILSSLQAADMFV